MHKTRTLKLNIQTERFCWIAISLIAGMFLMYIYFINVSVMNGAKFESITDQISNLQSEIAEAELHIVEEKRNINKEVAIEQGFEELEEIVFVTRTKTTALNAVTN